MHDLSSQEVNYSWKSVICNGLGIETSNQMISLRKTSYLNQNKMVSHFVACLIGK